MEEKRVQNEKLRDMLKEYFRTQPKEEKEQRLGGYKKKNLAILFLIIAGEVLVIAGFCVAFVLSMNSKDVSPNQYGWWFYAIIGVLATAFVYTLLRLVTFLYQTKTEVGLEDSFIISKIIHMSKGTRFELLDCIEKYEGRKISQGEYYKKRGEWLAMIFPPIQK